MIYADPLAGLTRAARLRREREDAEFIKSHAGIVRTASAASLKRDSNTWTGLDTFAAEHFQPYQSGESVDFIICARMDLDHPLYFPDNLFADCADCSCNLQYRPDAPPGERLCVCCAARRVREAGDG